MRTNEDAHRRPATGSGAALESHYPAAEAPEQVAEKIVAAVRGGAAETFTDNLRGADA